MRPGKEAMPQEPYLGNRGLMKGDIVNQPTLDPTTGKVRRIDPDRGDQIVDAKQSMDSATDTLRPLYGQADARDVIPTKREQILSDIMFDSFSTVLPGWGLGMQNKMFLMEEEREEKLTMAEPLSEPRQDIGPVDGPDRMPPEWKSSISRVNRKRMYRDNIHDDMLAAVVERRIGNGSTNVLGDDVGFLRAVSDRGLPRDRESVFEPIVMNSAPWQPVKMPAGYQLQAMEFRKTYDALRAPAKVHPRMAQDGGPTFPGRYAYEEMYRAPAMG